MNIYLVCLAALGLICSAKASVVVSEVVYTEVTTEVETITDDEDDDFTFSSSSSSSKTSTKNSVEGQNSFPMMAAAGAMIAVAFAAVL